jgi:hypothetical protein
MYSEEESWQIPTNELIDAILTIHAHITTLRGFLQSQGMDQDAYQEAFEAVRKNISQQLTIEASWKSLFRDLEPT